MTQNRHLKDFEKTLEGFDPKPSITITEPSYDKPKWLYDHCFNICSHQKMRPQPHYEMCNEVEEFLEERTYTGYERKAFMILVPRGCYKTTIMAEDLPIAEIINNPNIRILVCSHKASIANQRVDTIRKQFMHNTELHVAHGNDWVPVAKGQPWSTSQMTVAKRTKQFREATVTAGSVGANITGSHFNLIIADDLVHKDNVETHEQRNKVTDYLLSLYSLLDPGGRLIIIGTRWHSDDAYGRIIADDEDRGKQGLPELYKKYIRSCYDGPNGLYFPSEFSFDSLEDLKTRYAGSSARIFAANYLNSPVADSDLVFKPEYQVIKDFEYSTEGDHNGYVRENSLMIPVNTTMAWDTAGPRSHQKSDFHGLTVVGTDAASRYWVIHAEEYKNVYSVVVERVVALLLMYRPQTLLIESTSFQIWCDMVYERTIHHLPFLHITEALHEGIAKEERIAMLEPLWSARKIIMKQDQLTLGRQIFGFTMSNSLTHDDVLDSLAMHRKHTQPAESFQQHQDTLIDHSYQEYLKRQREDRRKSGLDKSSALGFLRRR